MENQSQTSIQDNNVQRQKKKMNVSSSVTYLSQKQIGELNLNYNKIINEKQQKQQIVPSRYIVQQRVKQITYDPKLVLNHMQKSVETIDQKYSQTIDTQSLIKKSKEIEQLQPIQKINTPDEFRIQPLKRQESDFQIFKRIFVTPKEALLQGLQNKTIDISSQFKSPETQYEEQINVYKIEERELQKKKQNKISEQNQNVSQVSKLQISTLLQQSQLKDDVLIKTGKYLKTTPLAESEKNYLDNLSVLEQSMNMENQFHSDTYIFDQQMQVMPPDKPNSSTNSPLSPGNGYAPSVPLLSDFKNKKSNIKDLLLRAKAGAQSGDIVSESHVTFYLGMIYETKKCHQSAIKYYKKFCSCAKILKDKFGLSIGTNRIAINYFYKEDYENAVEFNKQNIQISDQESQFPGYYNMGICYRKLRQYENALINLQKALDWTVQFNELEQQSLSYGQMGLLYLNMGEFDKAIDSFSKSYDLSKKVKNTKIQLECLLNLTKIVTQNNSLDNNAEPKRIIQDAIGCAKILNDNKTITMCYVNLGVMDGTINFSEFAEKKQADFPKEKIYDKSKLVEKERIVVLKSPSPLKLNQIEFPSSTKDILIDDNNVQKSPENCQQQDNNNTEQQNSQQ